MGVDLLRKIAPGFERALDRRAVALRTPTLFSRDVPLVARTAKADICNDAAFSPGEKVLLRLLEGKLIVQRENLLVAEFTNPPAEFFNQVRSGAGVGEGEIKAVLSLSQTVEIAFCE
jgi:hypothetical protein